MKPWKLMQTFTTGSHIWLMTYKLCLCKGRVGTICITGPNDASLGWHLIAGSRTVCLCQKGQKKTSNKGRQMVSQGIILQQWNDPKHLKNRTRQWLNMMEDQHGCQDPNPMELVWDELGTSATVMGPTFWSIFWFHCRKKVTSVFICRMSQKFRLI